MFSNKHVVIALIVAPILAILAWFAIGSLLGEQPHRAELGASYPLVALSNCRYPSGRCDLENQDFGLSIEIDKGFALTVSSKHALRGVLLWVGNSASQGEPSAMQAVAGDEMRWQLQLPRQPKTSDVFRLVAATEDNSYFGESSLEFIEP